MERRLGKTQKGSVASVCPGTASHPDALVCTVRNCETPGCLGPCTFRSGSGFAMRGSGILPGFCH